MSTVDVISTNQSLNALFTDYITCTLYLGQSPAGNLKIADQVRISVQKRLDYITLRILIEMRKQHFVKVPTAKSLQQAANQILSNDPSKADYYLSRLAIR